MRCVLTFLLFLTISATAGEPASIKHKATPEQILARQAELIAKLKDPYRVLNGVTNFPPHAEGWMKFHGKILSSSNNAIFVLGDFCPWPETWSLDSRTFFVTNFPYKIADNEQLGLLWMARDAGLHEYKDALGATHTVHQLDYGTPCAPPPLPSHITTNQVSKSPTNRPIQATIKEK